MHRILTSHLRPPLLLAAACLASVFAPVLPSPLVPAALAARAIEDPHARYAPPAPRSSQVVTPGAQARLGSAGRAALWVYFADKGEVDARGFARAVKLAGNRVTGHARDRRARETGGVFAPDYYDVPVVPGYVDAVRSAGARIRNVSRWMNAVSVEADAGTAQRIAALPFVRSVTEVAFSKRVQPVGPITPIETRPAPVTPFEEGALPSTGTRRGLAATLGPPASYGSSINQMSSINSKAAQDSGYTGAGVVVAMFDTGFNKAHPAVAPLKRIAEYDFVFHDGETANQAGDVANQWDHGTGTWSVAGGYADGNLIGPAYNASFLLAKTEDNRSETPVEEDNWLAAVEWADSIGADVISSSLGYLTFDAPYPSHTYADLDGRTTVVTQAAALAARRGIVVASAMGNAGPAVGSIDAPADADSILSVGAVDAGNALAGFSGRGPTADGRGKPEIVAQGVFTTWAVAANGTYGQASGTSLSTPLIGGISAQIREAHPEWTVQQIRYAMKLSGDKAMAPDSTNFGWGRPNVVWAIYSSPLGGPIFPKPFNLAFPPNGGFVNTPPFNFRWRRTSDPNGDPLTYRIRIVKASPDSLVYDATTTDTTITFPGYFGPSITYRWYVSAIDPGNHERVSRDQFTFATGSTTGVDITPPATAGAVLYPSRPNPVQSSAVIPFAISGTSPGGMARVTLRIYDAGGRLVRTLLRDDAEVLPIVRLTPWDGRNEKGQRVSSGIYYYRLTVSGRDISRRMVVLR
jgi:hypothetical protein